MKKLYLTILIISLFFSCSRKDRKKITLTEFDTVFIDSLEPKENNVFRYAMYNVWIEGYVNDSIRIRLSLDPSDDSYWFHFQGNIKERLYTDYYGDFKRYIYFDPYKATEGKLEIKYGLY